MERTTTLLAATAAAGVFLTGGFLRTASAEVEAADPMLAISRRPARAGRIAR